jgi:hypothetical protein
MTNQSVNQWNVPAVTEPDLRMQATKEWNTFNRRMGCWPFRLLQRLNGGGDMSMKADFSK